MRKKQNYIQSAFHCNTENTPTLFLLLLVAVSLLIPPVFAGQARADAGVPDASIASPSVPIIRDNVTLDSRTYTRAEIVDALDRLLFNEVDPPEYRQWDERGGDDFPDWVLGNNLVSRLTGNPRWLKDRYPWIAEYIFRPNGMPKRMAVKKWDRPIRLAMGYPMELRPVNATNGNTAKPEDYIVVREFVPGFHGHGVTVQPETISEVEAIARETLAELSSLTNQHFEFVPANEDVGPDFANLRIVLHANSRGWLNPFRLERKPLVQRALVTGYSGVEWRTFHGSIEPLIRGINYFNPNNSDGIDGYLLTNEKGEAGFAVCHILQSHRKSQFQKSSDGPTHNKAELRGLVHECVLRSLGLTGRLGNEWYSHFSGWFEDGRFTKSGMTEADRFFVKTLYSPAVRAGMPRDELLNLLKN